MKVKKSKYKLNDYCFCLNGIKNSVLGLLLDIKKQYLGRIFIRKMKAQHTFGEKPTSFSLDAYE